MHINKKNSWVILIVLIFIGCNNPSNDEKQMETKQVTIQPDLKQTISENQLATKKDPVCGMPAYKFLKDTAVFENKIYGFCGKGCKDEFLKAPQKFSVK